MTQLAESHLTVKEAAFIAGVGERIVNHEIDAGIIPSQLTGGDRRIRGFDVLYLSAVRNIRDGLGPPFRHRLRNAIAKAASEQAAEATVEHFHVLLRELEAGLLGAFGELQAARHDHIESRAEVLAGEPVIKGTRVAARHATSPISSSEAHRQRKSETILTSRTLRSARQLFSTVSRPSEAGRYVGDSHPAIQNRAFAPISPS